MKYKYWLKDELSHDDVKFTNWERWSSILVTIGVICGIGLVVDSDSEITLKIVAVGVLVLGYCSVTNGVALSRIEKRLYVIMRIMYETHPESDD